MSPDLRALLETVDPVRRAQVCAEALATYRREPGADPRTLTNLANLLAEYGDDMDEPIAAYEQALSTLTADDDPTLWGQVQHNLALAWRDRTRGDHAANLERAVTAYERALAARAAARLPEPWATTAASFAVTLLERLDGDRSVDVDRAVELLEQALGMLAGARRARAQHNLAIAYRLRGWPGDAGRAVDAARAALVHRTRERSAADWVATTAELAQAHVAGGDLTEAVRYYEQTLEELREDREPDEWARVTFNAALVSAAAGDLAAAEARVRAALRVFTSAGHPLEHRLALGKLGDFAFQSRDWERAGRAYDAAMAAGELLFAATESDALRRREVGDTSYLYARAAYALLHRSRAGEAIVTLERGKARLLRDRLAVAPPAGLGLASILAAVPAGGAVVLPVVTSQGGAALVLPAGRADVTADDVLWLDHLTDRAVVELLGGAPEGPLTGWLGEFMAARDVPADSPDRRAWEREIADSTGRLWSLLMGPVHERLTALGLRRGAPVVIVPSGGLGLLPLAAARGPDGAFLDDFTVLVAPSTAALPAGERPPAAPSVLAVADPVGDLPYARAEAQLVAAAFPAPRSRLLRGAAATVPAVLTGATRTTHLHLACHGRHSWSNARSSALTLGGGTALTVGEITGGPRLDAVRLVTLSACETGLTELGRGVDEQVGLPAALLLAGAAAVVSTLWSVDDATTALLMTEFYRRHVTCAQDSADALRAAQRWLRDLDRDATLAALEPVRAVAEQRRDSGDAADVRMWAAIENFRDDLLATRAPRERPWASPYHWAGFVHVGRGQRVEAASGSP